MPTRTEAKARPLTRATLSRWRLPDPGAAADKEARGHVLVVAGSHEMPGAALLAAVAALRAGAGKLTIAAPACVAQGLALAIPESRVIGMAESRGGGFAPGGVKSLEGIAAGIAAVVLGPGMLDEGRSARFVRSVLPLFKHGVVVLDALAMSAAGPRAFGQAVVMTPHAGEMAHLSGLSKEAVAAAPLKVAREAAARWNATVALKGAVTYLAQPDGAAWRFAGGTPGLATSGSGDTLAGLIGGLAARGASPMQAAAWGVSLHAGAGQVLKARQGELGYIARELAAEVPALIQGLDRFGRHNGQVR